jgi:HD domain-containing protein
VARSAGYLAVWPLTEPAVTPQSGFELLERTFVTTPTDASTAFALPDSPVSAAARKLVSEVSPAFLHNHCVRSYLFARELAAADGLRADVDYDDELVFLSCVLHDLGATDYANGDQRFEIDGADAAAAFLADQGVDEARARPVWEAIALHTSVGLGHRFGPVAAVAHLGITADVVGQGKEALPAGFADRVHAALPRHDLGYALSDVLAQQVETNPAKGGPMTFPGQVHQLCYPRARAVSFFDALDASGWNDRPIDGRVAGGSS